MNEQDFVLIHRFLAERSVAFIARYCVGSVIKYVKLAIATCCVYRLLFNPLDNRDCVTKYFYWVPDAPSLSKKIF